MVEECLFCKIAGSEISSEKVYEDDLTLAFRDINAQAPIHVLVIPKAHFDDITGVDEDTMGAMLKAIKAVVKSEGLKEGGFRLATNTGKDGGQLVRHVHWHVLGGRAMGPVLG